MTAFNQDEHCIQLEFAPPLNCSDYRVMVVDNCFEISQVWSPSLAVLVTTELVAITESKHSNRVNVEVATM